MGKNSKGVRDFADAARLEAYEEFRKDVDPGRLGLALQAIRQRVDQDLMIAVAAYEIDCNLTDKNHRIKHNPVDAFPEILAVKARLDVVDDLMKKYEEEYLALHPEIAKQIEEELEGPEQGVEFVDPTEVGWDTIETPVESDSADTDE